MPARKKIVRKKSTKKRVSKKSVRTIQGKTSKQISVNPENERILVENFVGLQRVMTNLAVKLDGLSIQISKLLELFEISAKALAEKGMPGEEGAKEIRGKVDNILEQNKVLARGITLLHEKEPYEQHSENQNIQPQIGMRPNYPSKPQIPFRREVPSPGPQETQINQQGKFKKLPSS